MFFSVIIPVFNRPLEIRELLLSLKNQTYADFEVVIVEDGSSMTCETVLEEFMDILSIRYLTQQNSGQGFARNYGMKRASGDFFVILDSDVILPKNYLQVLNRVVVSKKLDAFGGPDAAADNFSVLQKAMDFAMTSFWTTGGIRGKLKDPSKYQARGFNMGISRAVFEHTGGFKDPNRGEDIEWSLRIKKEGFRLELIEEAFVYHKRKNTLFSFAKQAFSFGRNRVNVSRFHPGAIQPVHVLPSLFFLFILSMPVSSYFAPSLFYLQLPVFVGWVLAVLFTAIWHTGSLAIGILCLATSLTQLLCYGFGLLYELVIKWTMG